MIANAHEPQPRTRTVFNKRRGLVFVGNFNHLPNRDAVLYFANEATTPLPSLQPLTLATAPHPRYPPLPLLPPLTLDPPTPCTSL